MDMRFSCYIVLGVIPNLAMSEEMLFPLDVQILNKQLEISAYLNDEQEDNWALEGNELLPTLIESLKPSRLETLRGVFSDRKVTQDDFKQLGWEADYDAGTLVVQIKVPVADKKTIDIPFGNSGVYTPPTGMYQAPTSTFSGLLNSYWSHSHNLIDTEYSASQVALRGLFAFGPITFEDGHTYTYNHFTNEGYWLRDRTRLMTNLPNNAGYLQFGDYLNETDIESLPSSELFGLSYSYQPSYLKTYSAPNVVPISIQTPSLVTIRINGEDYRNLRLAAGEYNLNNLPLEQGVNEVEVTYIDQSGVEQKRYFNLIDHPQLLLKGDIETQWVYGAEQVYEDDGDKDIDTEKMAGQAVISYGLTDWWTLSPSFAIHKERDNYALKQSFAIGDYFLSLDGSYNDYHDYESYDLSNQLYSEELFYGALTSTSLTYGVNRTNDDTPLTQTVSLSSGVETPIENGYLSFSLQYQFNNEETLSQTASINTSYRFNNNLSTSLNLRWQRYNDTIDRSFYANVSIPFSIFGQSVSASTSYNSTNDEYQSSLSASKYDPSYYWRTSAQFVDENYDGFDAYGKWYLDKVNLNARYSSTNESNDSTARTLTVGADTGVAWSGNHVAWTSPLGSSFNLVSIPKAYKEKYALSYDEYKRLQILPVEDGGSSTVVVPVPNENFKLIRISGDNLDFNEELKQKEFVVKGGLYTGSHCQLDIVKGYFVSGFLHNLNQEPLADVVGEFQNQLTNENYPFFTDEEGNFELDTLPEGHYFVYFYDGVAQSFELDISKSQVVDDVFIDLGMLKTSKLKD